MDDNILIASSRYSPTNHLYVSAGQRARKMLTSLNTQRSILPIMTGAFSDTDLTWRTAVSTQTLDRTGHHNQNTDVRQMKKSMKSPLNAVSVRGCEL